MYNICLLYCLMKTYEKTIAALLSRVVALRARGPGLLRTKPLAPAKPKALPANRLTTMTRVPQVKGRMQSKRRTRADKALRELVEGAEPGKYYTLHEIAEVMGITRERVRQIEMKAKRNFRNRLLILIKSEGVTPEDLASVFAATRT